MDRQSHPKAPSHAGGAQRISVQLNVDPGSAADARDALAAIEGRVDDQVMDDVRLLVSELVTNSVRHSRTPEREQVELDVWVDSTAIRVEVRDHGEGFDPRPRPIDRSTPGGWGLYLVQRLADRWGVACKGVTRVWFEIDFLAARSRRQL